MPAIKLCQWCLIWNLFVGAALVFGGLAMCAVPLAQLDATLTPEELKDPVLRETTQARLLRRWGNSWATLVVAGTATGLASLIGLCALQRLERQPKTL